MGLAALASLCAVATAAAETVVVQLRWDHQFQFAGFYAADWQGYYRDAGIQVDLRPGVTPERGIRNTIDEVVSGRAQFGVASADLLVARDAGKPVVALAPLFQQSPVAVFTRAGNAAFSPASLIQMRVKRYPRSLIDVEFQTMLRAEGLDPDQFEFSTDLADHGLEGLVSGRIDAFAGFTLDALWRARSAGVAVSTLRPATYGVDFYGDTLFTTAEVLRARPDLVRRFATATVKGWEYALAHPAEIARRIAAELPRVFPLPDPERFNLFQAEEISRLMLHPLVQPGHNNPGRWRRMHSVLSQAGLIQAAFHEDAFSYRVTADDDAIDPRILWLLVGLVCLTVLATILVFAWGRSVRRTVDRRTAELRESDRRLNEAQRIAGIGSWELDLRCNELRWSDEIYRIFELDPKRFAASYEAFLDAIHPDDRAAVDAAYTRSLQERTPYHITHRLLMPDGRIKWVEERCETEFAPDGRPLRSRGTVQDVTEIKRVEAAVRESQARLSGLLEIAPEGIIATDEHGMVQLFNKGAELIFGYGSHEMIGQPIEMLIPERFRIAHRRHLLALADGPDTSRNMTGRGEVVGRRRDGTEFPAEAGISKLTFHDERVFTVIIRDVTERRQAERALLKAKEEAEIASRAKTEFLANMSHELRTPLNAILGFSEIVHQELLGPLGNHQYAEYCKDIHSAGSHLLGVINDILDLSRIETGHMEMADDLVEVDRAVEACLRIVQQRANENGLAITKDIAADFPPLRADERKLKQMLINLLSNAVKFTPAGGSIRISAVLSEDGGADIRVADTGVGMNPEDVPRALRPFTQLDSRLSRRYEGAGLGLPLVKSLCELHGGALAIETREGAGTTVRLHFPPSRVVPRPAKLAVDAA